MKYFVHLDGVVTGFNFAGQNIDCLCGTEILKVEKQSGNVVYRKQIFEKEGFARKLIADKKQIFISDFCMLYIFRQDNYELIGKWQLGNDLRSDIVDIAFDNETVFCSIRNGKIITLDRKSFAINEYQISESSMWCIRTYDKFLACGTVDGKLLLLDKSTLSIEKMLVLSKKNIGRIYIDGNTLYAASHDGKFFKIDLTIFQISVLRKNIHKKMFGCAGVYKDTVVTVSYPCSEISFWDKKTLEHKKTVNVPLRLSGQAYIESDFLYIASRNISGIDKIALNGLV